MATKEQVTNLAENYGTYDLLTAYIMRTLHVSYEFASDVICQVDYDLERWLCEMIANEEEEEQ
jgi:hypothetical protein